MVHYKIYGLNITSELVLHPAKRNNKQAIIDVDVRVVDKIVFDKSIAVSINRFWVNNKNEVYLEGEYGSILVQNGNTILVELKNTQNSKLASQHVLGSGLGIILHQAKKLVLHGSAVCKNNEAIIFLGKSGNGKSSTAALMQKKGYQLLSDDLSVISIEDGVFFVQPGFSKQKLAQDFLHKMDMPIGQSEESISEGRIKYWRDSDSFHNKPVPIKHIYCIRKQNIPQVEIRDNEDDLYMFYSLYRNAYRFKLIEPLGFKREHFTLCQQLYNQVNVKMINYPTTSIDLQKTLSVIMSDIEKN